MAWWIRRRSRLDVGFQSEDEIAGPPIEANLDACKPTLQPQVVLVRPSLELPFLAELVVLPLLVLVDLDVAAVVVGPGLAATGSDVETLPEGRTICGWRIFYASVAGPEAIALAELAMAGEAMSTTKP